LNLLSAFDALLQSWRVVFPQQRSFDRAYRLTFGLLACLREHLTSSAICTTGRQFLDWSADYRLFNRSPWDPHRLFDAVIDGALAGSKRNVVSDPEEDLCWIGPFVS
jgi:hypothetical protein